MTTRQHSLFDPANLGPDLEITQGGEVIQPAADSLTNERTARATQPQTVGVWSVEFLAWGLDDPLSAIVGIVTADASLSDYVGADAYGIGYDLASGEVLNAGVVLTTITAADKGDIISIQADLAEQQVLIYLNGALLHTEPLPSSMAGAAIYPAASMGSDIEADGRVFMNAGQRAFEYPLADSDGWYSIPVTIDTVRIADTQSYFTAGSDEIPHAEYYGCVAAQSVTVVRSLNFWPWGDTRSRGTAAQFAINDPDGRYDLLIGANVRDLEATIHSVPDGGTPFASADLVGSFVVERVTAPNDGQKVITFRDRTAVLDQPVQTRLFLPNLPEEIANRPIPIRLGVTRSIEPLLIDSGLASSGAFPVFQVSDAPLQGLGILRDKGDPLDLGVDWSVRAGQQQIELVNNPEGKLTFDCSSVGGSSVPTNILPTTLADWDAASNVTGTTVLTFGPILSAVENQLAAYVEENAVLTAGRVYSYIIAIDSITAAVGAIGTANRILIGENLTPGIPNTQDSPHAAFSSPGTYSGTFTAAATGPFSVALRVVAGVSCSAVVSALRLFEGANAVSDTLQPITLEGFAREVLQTRGGLRSDQWSAADAAAIDTATGYGLGFSATEPVSVGQALQAALVGFGACYWQDRAGVIRFTRLIDPASQTPTGTITQDSMLSDLAVSRDDAPGLTAQIAGRRNYTVLNDTDFVTDFVEVPLALRKTLGRRFRAIRTTGVPFPSEYAHARGATDPLETLIDEPESLQAEIDRVAALYQTVRYFYQLDVPFEALSGYELGQTWTLEYPRYGLDAGKDCLIVAITEDHVNEIATLRLWG